MSFVPVTGPATFRVADPPRDSVVEFSDDRRTITLPIRAALPVLTKAHTRDDLHPTVGLLSGAALLGLRLVAAGRLRPDEVAASWRMAPLDADDTDRVVRLAAARGPDDPAAAESLVREVLDAIADAMPRSAPLTRREVRDGSTDFGARLEQRLARQRRPRDEDLPQLVRISLRVEADEEELVAGAVRLVLQVHDERDPLHLCDAAELFTGTDHGFGSRARTHASIALRAAADAWPVLDRLLGLRVPDEITLDTDELVSLLEHGVGALADRGVDVLWPRSLGRDLTSSAVLDRREPSVPRGEPLHDGLFGADALFSFNWQLALHGDPLTQEEMDQLAAAAGPILKLRGSWTVVDPALARKARKRLVRTVRPAEAIASALTGTVQVADVDHEVHVGASLLRMREMVLEAPTREPIPQPEGLTATLRDYQRHGLTWLADLTSLGLGACLADDMGLGKTVTLIALHLHRGGGPDARRLPGQPARQLGGRDRPVRPGRPRPPAPRQPARPRRRRGLRADDVRHHAGRHWA